MRNRLHRLLVGAALMLVSLSFTGCGGTGRAQRAFESAEEAREAKQFDAARIGYRNVLRTDPRHVGALRGLGVILFDCGVAVESARLLGLADDRAPRDPVVVTYLGRALFELGLVGDARRMARIALHLIPVQREALMLVAETATTPEEFAESYELLAGLVDVDPGGVDLAVATLALRSGEVQVARARVTHALEREANLAAGHALLAVVKSQLGDSDDALASSQRAAELSPVRSSIRLRHAMFLIAMGELTDAEAFLEEITFAAPDFATAWRVRAQLAIQTGERAAADEFLQQALIRSPVDLTASVLQAELRLADGDVDAALRMMTKVREFHPPNPAIEFVLARCHVRNGDLGPARELIGRVLRMDAAHAGAILLNARMQVANGEASLATLAMEELVARRPDLGEAQLLLAEAYGASGRRAEASAILERRAQVAESDFLPHLQLGLALRNEGRLSEARVALERAGALKADDLVVLSLLVELDLSEERVDEAHARIDERLTKAPGVAVAHLLRAMVYIKQERVAEAMLAARSAVAYDSGLLRGYSLLVQLHRNVGNGDEAIEELSRFLEQSPADRAALMLKGTLLHEAGRLDEAAECYEILLRTDPMFGPALNNLASIKSRVSGELDAAFILANRAAAALPNEAAVAETLGAILYKRGDYSRALPLLRQAAAGLPDDGQVQYHYGIAAYMMDEREQAAAAFDRAIDAGVDGPVRDEIATQRAIILDESGVEELRARVAVSATDAIARLRLGQALDAVGDAQAAEAYMLEALEINPDLLAARTGLAALYSGTLAKPERALEMAKAARVLAPGCPIVAALIGRIAFAAGDHPWAYDLLREAASGGGMPARAKLDLAWAAYSLGRVDEARSLMDELLVAGGDAGDEAAAQRFLRWTGDAVDRDLEEVLKVTPDYVPAMMVNGDIHEASGRLDEAAAIYGRVRDIHPHFVPAKVGLARVLLNVGGSIDEAKELIVQVRESFPSDPEVLALLARVSLLQEDHLYGAELMRQVADAGWEMHGMDWYVLGMCLHKLGNTEDGREALEKALSAGLREPEASRVRVILQDDG